MKTPNNKLTAPTKPGPIAQAFNEVKLKEGTGYEQHKDIIQVVCALLANSGLSQFTPTGIVREARNIVREIELQGKEPL